MAIAIICNYNQAHRVESYEECRKIKCNSFNKYIKWFSKRTIADYILNILSFFHLLCKLIFVSLTLAKWMKECDVLLMYGVW